MSIVNGKFECVACKKEKVAYSCSGCSQLFCFNHLGEHRQQLTSQLNDLEDNRNILLEDLTEQKINSEKHSLIEQINQWKKDSIDKIEQTAKECIELLIEPIKENIGDIEIALEELTRQIKEIREENDINETVLNQLKETSEQLEEEFHKPSHILIKQDSSSFINKISVIIYSRQYNIRRNSKWIPHGITLAGGNGKGNDLNQLSEPWGIYVDDDQSICVADYSNNRVVEWRNGATTGQVVACTNNCGYTYYHLNSPTAVIIDKKNDSLIIADSGNRKVSRWPRQNTKNVETIISDIRCSSLVMDKDGYVYASDVEKHEVRRWKIGEKNGTLLAGGNGKGDHSNQLNYPYNIFVDQDQSVYVSDRDNHRVMKWIKGAKEGIIVAGGQGNGNNVTQLSSPCGIIVDQLGTVYVADYGNDRVMRWCEGAKEGSVIIGRYGKGAQANQFSGPVSLSFDQQNNLYVTDFNNCRIQKFNIELKSIK